MSHDSRQFLFKIGKALGVGAFLFLQADFRLVRKENDLESIKYLLVRLCQTAFRILTLGSRLTLQYLVFGLFPERPRPTISSRLGL